MMTEREFRRLTPGAQRGAIEDAVRGRLRRCMGRPDPLRLALLDIAAGATTVILILDFHQQRGLPLSANDADVYVAACRDRDLALAQLGIPNPYAPRVH